MKDFLKKNLLEITVIILGCFFAIIAYLSEGCYQGGDNYTRYHLARYSFQNPIFFLHHWGKPLYILIAAPFAQFGFFSLKLLNVIMGVSAGYTASLIISHFSGRRSFITPFLVCFAPMYFLLLNSAFTEILFSFLLTFSIYLTLKNRYISAAILFSLLYFVRNEAIIILPFVAFHFFLNKTYKFIPLLLSGFVLYSFLGVIGYDDLLWILHQNPYTGAEAIYGHGTFSHYFENAPEVFGASLLFLLGISFSIILKKRSSIEKIKEDSSFWILIVFPAASYFLFHTVLWWKGMGGSLGEPRIMVSIIPLIAIIAEKGLTYIKHSVAAVFSIAAVLFQVAYPIRNYEIIMPLDQQKIVARDAAAWLNQGNISGKIYYHDPVVAYFVGFNPYDHSKIQQYLPSYEKPDELLKPGDLIVWDAHFSPNEGKVPFERISSNDNLSLVKIFNPSVPFKVLGGHNYQICVFRKEAAPVKKKVVPLKFHDFTGIDPHFSPERLSSNSRSTPKSFILDSGFPYSPGFESDVESLIKSKVVQLNASCYIFPDNDPQRNNGGLIISFENQGKTNGYYILNVKELQLKKGEWNQVTLSAPVPPTASSGDIVKVYYWESGTGTSLVDDFNVSGLAKQ